MQKIWIVFILYRELEDHNLDDVIITMEVEEISFIEAYHQMLHLEEAIKETEREREDY